MVRPGVVPFLALALALAPLGAGAERGGDGVLRVSVGSVPDVLNPYASGSFAVETASIVLEPLALHDPQGALVPRLAEAVPSLANGGLDADLRRATWRLREGIVWSDGTPLTARDVAFTWALCSDRNRPSGFACDGDAGFAAVEAVVARDDLTVEIRFREPTVPALGPFVGAARPVLQEAQFRACLGPSKDACAAANALPVGTGPFAVDRNGWPTDWPMPIRFKANPHFRDPGRPAFAVVQFESEKTLHTSLRSVLETGRPDIVIAPGSLSAWTASPGALRRGRIATAFGDRLAFLHVNLTDPDPALGERRSTPEGGPHPVLSDPRVRRALALAIDRRAIEDIDPRMFRVRCSLLPGVPPADPGCATQDADAANRLLDAAGWVRGPDGVRAKDGRRLELVLQMRPRTVYPWIAERLGAAWQHVGVGLRTRSLALMFIHGDPDSSAAFERFEADLALVMARDAGPDPLPILDDWRCAEIPRPAGHWSGSNLSRHCDPAHDALVAGLAALGDPAERAAVAAGLERSLVEAGVVIPLVEIAEVIAVANDLAGPTPNPWEPELWNIAEWRRQR